MSRFRRGRRRGDGDERYNRLDGLGGGRMFLLRRTDVGHVVRRTCVCPPAVLVCPHVVRAFDEELGVGPGARESAVLGVCPVRTRNASARGLAALLDGVGPSKQRSRLRGGVARVERSGRCTGGSALSQRGEGDGERDDYVGK